MTREQHLKAIREACVRANPEILKRVQKVDVGIVQVVSMHIRLADVLLAMEARNRQDHRRFRVDEVGWLWIGDETPKVKYNLRADDLEQQSDEFVEFLYNLLKL